MNYLQMLDEIEETLSKAKKIPLSTYAILAEDKLREMICSLREHYPDEIKRSSMIINQKEELIQEAKKEAQIILTEAQKEREYLCSQQEVYKQALIKAESTKKETKEDLITMLRNMNEILVGLTQNYHQQCLRMDQQIEESYRQSLEKFQQIKDQIIDPL
jgi:cell division septum initiation protein DivIVA